LPPSMGSASSPVAPTVGGVVRSPPGGPRKGGPEMAYGIVHHFPQGTKAQYEASVAAVHPGPGQLPEGQIHHTAGPDDGGGWTIVAMHASEESWERFRRGTLLPA